MKKIILYILLLFTTRIYSKDLVNCMYEMIIGKWEINYQQLNESMCSIPLDYSFTKNEPFSLYDSTIIFDNNKYYTNNGKIGNYKIENISKTDTITKCEFYLYLDSIQYDIILSSNRLLIEKHYGKFKCELYHSYWDFYLHRKDN